MESEQRAGETQGGFFPTWCSAIYILNLSWLQRDSYMHTDHHIHEIVHSEITQTHPTNLYLVTLQATVHLKIQLFSCFIFLMALDKTPTRFLSGFIERLRHLNPQMEGVLYQHKMVLSQWISEKFVCPRSFKLRNFALVSSSLKNTGYPMRLSSTQKNSLPEARINLVHKAMHSDTNKKGLQKDDSF